MSTKKETTTKAHFEFERGIVLRDEKQRLTKEHQEYLGKHPEIAEILSDFVGDVLAKQPENISKFAQEHFGGMIEKKEEVVVEGIPKKEEKKQQMMMGQIRPLVMMGPSGVGKGTVIKKLMEKEPEAFGFSVSHTTRKPREGEREGIEYHFVKEGREKMEEMIARGEFLEHAEVHGNLYGTSKAAVKDVSEKGKICILDIDVQGGQQLRHEGADCIYVFLEPPSMAELEDRLRKRKTESEDAIQVRLRNAKIEMEASFAPGFVDFRVVNDVLERCVDDVFQIISPELLRRRQLLLLLKQKQQPSTTSSK